MLWHVDDIVIKSCISLDLFLSFDDTERPVVGFRPLFEEMTS